MAIQVQAGRGGRRFGPGAVAFENSWRLPAAALPVYVRAPVSGCASEVQEPSLRTRAREGAGTRRPYPGNRYTSQVSGTECVGDVLADPAMGRWARLSLTLVVAAAVIVSVLTLTVWQPAAATRPVTVLPGDTVYSLLQREVPTMDVGQARAALDRLNGAAGKLLVPGTVLYVPAP